MNVLSHGRNLKELHISKVYIWGGGEYGISFLKEVKLYVPNVKLILTDTSDVVRKFFAIAVSPEKFCNRIAFEQEKSAIVICIHNEMHIKNVYERLNRISNDNITIYVYKPLDIDEMKQLFTTRGLFNGNKMVHMLDEGRLLTERISTDNPFLYARWGGVEGEMVYGNRAGIILENDIFLKMLFYNAGFYPVTEITVRKFSEIMESAASQIDILYPGTWCRHVEELYALYSPNARLSDGKWCFFEKKPWTHGLRNKRVLVIHPFAKVIASQYLIRDCIFPNNHLLPDFKLITYKAIQSVGGNDKYQSWFDALEKMENDISEIDFDIALIGCGAYGMPLGAFIKNEMKKQAIHLGGCLQLFFGIKGRRWDNGIERYRWQESGGEMVNLYNEYWVRPSADLRPRNWLQIEDGCYW